MPAFSHTPAYQVVIMPPEQETDPAMTNVQGVINDGDN